MFPTVPPKLRSEVLLFSNVNAASCLHMCKLSVVVLPAVLMLRKPRINKKILNRNVSDHLTKASEGELKNEKGIGIGDSI